MDPAPPKHARIRWWPLLLIVAATIGAVVVIQLREDTNQQQANMNSAAALALGALAAFAWLLLLSRMPWRTRGLLAGLIVVAGAGLAATVRVRGVTGDLLPLLEWRFGSTEVPAAQAEEGAALAPPLLMEDVVGLADFPQFRGPQRDGVLAGPRLARDWTAQPPEELWRQPVGEGWAGFAVVGRRALTLEQHGEQEAVTCYDAVSGALLWVHRDDARYGNPVGGIGPRSTPTVEGNRVYTLGATGRLNCLELATGAVVWSKDIVAENDALVPSWGVAGSPLVLGDLVVVSAGGVKDSSLVAYDRATGARAWSGGDQRAHYASPQRATLAGVEQILVFNHPGVAGHAADDGRVLWTYPWKPTHPHVCQPTPVGDDRVLIASGYGSGCHLVQVRRTEEGGFTTERLWRSLAMKAKFANVIVLDGFVYGLDDGTLACVDLATGKRRWKRGRDGHGQLLLVGDLLLLGAEYGDIVLLEPSPQERRELTRFTALTAKTWNPPTLAGRYLLVRNDQEAACFRLPVVDG